MEYIAAKNLIGLSVYAESGAQLGRVVDFEIDVAAQAILRYIIRKKIFTENLIVSAAQVVSLSAEKMVIRDGSVKEIAAAGDERFRPQAEISGVAMSKN